MLYYIYCIEMGRSDKEFYESTLAKTITLIELHGQFKTGKVERMGNEEIDIKSMKQIPGFI